MHIVSCVSHIINGGSVAYKIYTSLSVLQRIYLMWYLLLNDDDGDDASRNKNKTGAKCK